MKREYYKALTITAIVWLIFSGNSNSKNDAHFKTQNKKTMNDTVKMQVKVSGEGTPLVLVPGGLTGWKSWEPFVDIFAAKQKKVIRVQLLNVQYGLENRALPKDYAVKTESRALAATLDSLGQSEPLDIIAWSYGALIALDYALDHPERIRSLALIEPPAFWVLQAQGPPDNATQQMINFHNTFRGDITEDMLAAFLQDAGLVKAWQSARDMPQWEQWVPFRRSLRSLPAIYAHKDEVTRLQSLELPVLLVNGADSSKFYYQIIEVLAANLPNARVIEMPGGHAPHIVSTDRFLSAWEHFQNEQ